jgi:hypothetical protein
LLILDSGNDMNEGQKDNLKISRRTFLKLAGLASLGGLLAACGPNLESRREGDKKRYCDSDLTPDEIRKMTNEIYVYTQLDDHENDISGASKDKISGFINYFNQGLDNNIIQVCQNTDSDGIPVTAIAQAKGNPDKLFLISLAPNAAGVADAENLTDLMHEIIHFQRIHSRSESDEPVLNEAVPDYYDQLVYYKLKLHGISSNPDSKLVTMEAYGINLMVAAVTLDQVGLNPDTSNLYYYLFTYGMRNSYQYAQRALEKQQSDLSAQTGHEEDLAVIAESLQNIQISLEYFAELLPALESQSWSDTEKSTLKAFCDNPNIIAPGFFEGVNSESYNPVNVPRIMGFRSFISSSV